MRILLTEALKAEYQLLFSQCIVSAEHIHEVDQQVAAMIADADRYHQLSARTQVPWYVVAILHTLETQRNFAVHLHNGDPLSERTVHLPDGHPQQGQPPFSWEDSAEDALRLAFLDQWEDWSLPGTLFKLEGYHGWQYRVQPSAVLSPYLWSYCNHYQQGIYVGDLWQENSTYPGPGAATLLRRLTELDVVAWHEDPLPIALRLRYQETATGNGDPHVMALQAFLNRLPGLYLRIDGWAGSRTSAAVQQVFGFYLPGDHRQTLAAPSDHVLS